MAASVQGDNRFPFGTALDGKTGKVYGVKDSPPRSWDYECLPAVLFTIGADGADSTVASLEDRTPLSC